MSTQLKGLNKLLPIWQKRLRLQDWRVVIGIAQFENNNTYGQTDISKINFAEATIAIREGLVGKDLEETLVHELLHLRFAYLSMLCVEEKINERGFAELELGIELTARALVEAYGD